MSSNIKIQRICNFCEMEFTAKTTVTQYCSDKCAKLAYKARIKASKIEASNKETTSKKTKAIQEIGTKEFLTVGEVAKLLNCSKRSAYYYVQSGTIKATNLGQRMTRVKRSDIDKLFSIPEPIMLKPFESINDFKDDAYYTTKEVRQKYKLSEGALQTLLTRNDIPKFKKGWFAYVPKTEIDSIFNITTKSVKHGN